MDNRSLLSPVPTSCAFCGKPLGMISLVDDKNRQFCCVEHLIEGGVIGRFEKLVPDWKRIKELEAALREIIERWDTPAWKDAEPTGHVINRARALLPQPPGE